MKNEKALVLLSGGQDSATCLAVALQQFNGQVEAIGFDYGQRHKIELFQAQKIAGLACVPFQVFDLKILSHITENALTRHDQKIEDGTSPNTPPNTNVDGRNQLFLTAAAIYAKLRGIQTLYMGVCQTDFSGYPDCRDIFIKSMNVTLNLSMNYDFLIKTPLMFLTKGESILLMQKLGKLDWYKHTQTCYMGIRPACGTCPACKIRLNGFREAGLEDPLDYAPH